MFKVNFSGYTIEISFSWIREVSNTYVWIFLDCVILKLLWFAFLIWFNIIVAPGWRVAAFDKEHFSNLSFFWYLVYLSGPSLSLRFPYYLELESKEFNFTNFFLESAKISYNNNWCMLLTITTNVCFIQQQLVIFNNWYMFSVKSPLHLPGSILYVWHK